MPVRVGGPFDTAAVRGKRRQRRMLAELLGSLSDRALVGVLVSARVAGLVAAGPVFGTRQVPARVRVAVVLALTVFLTPIVAPHIVLPRQATFLVPALCNELALGLLLGFACSLVVEVVRFAGAVANVQMTLASARMFDPTSGVSAPFVAELYYMVAVLVFLSMDGHHWLISGVARSFQHIPIGGANWSGAVADSVIGTAGMIFEMSLKIAAPALGALFLTDLALGLLSRAVPQMHVFIVGIPGKIFVGIAILALAAPVIVMAIGDLMRDMRGILMALLRALTP